MCRKGLIVPLSSDEPMPRLVVLLLMTLLTACNNGGDSAQTSSRPTLNTERSQLQYGGAEAAASCQSHANLDGGRAYHVNIPSRVDGENISFQVHEPDSIDCGKKHALLLQGHGYSGSRETAVGAFSRFTGAGYTVISIDQRGSPDSGGTVRVMDPDFEGEDLVAIVDWAEQHLDYLKYRDNNLLLGAIGGSYGGMYQFLLLNKDPDLRLDAIVPEIAPHDLNYSLNPGGVVKSQWSLILAGAGDVLTSMGQDPMMRATLIEGGITGKFPEPAEPFFAYHSMQYFCDNPLDLQPDFSGNTAEYLLDPLYQLLPLTAGGEYTVLTPSNRRVPRIDALLFQGPRDDLFNMNEAWNNYQCLKRAGGDVRLLTYSSGHHILTPNLGVVEQGLAQGGFPFSSACGPINSEAAALAWFNEKLLGIGNADDVIITGQDMCFALDMGDAVQLPDMTIGGTEFPVEMPGGLPAPVTIGNPLPVVVPLTTVAGESEVLAGIPTASLAISSGDPALDARCQEKTDPIMRLGTCDATVFIGLGVIKSGSVLPLVPELIEEQVMPVRGLGQHEVELVGISERIASGDQIVLLLYGTHDAFVLFTSSRDLLTPVVTVTGSVRIPMQGHIPSL